MKMFIRFLLALILLPISIIGLCVVAVALVVLMAPDVRTLKGCMITNMHHVDLCPKNKDYVPLKNISRIAIEAVLASEDTTFYQHNGFDWFEIKNSISKDMNKKGFARGGSTITQQLAKNVFLTGEKSLLRKGREAFLTYELEKNFSKDEILEKYFNVVELGPNIFGIKPAAAYYFKKAPSELNILEATFLAFLLPNPKGYHKSFRDKKLTPFARSRIVELSSRLMHFHKTTPEMYERVQELVDRFPWSGITTAELEQKPIHEVSEAPVEAVAPSTEEQSTDETILEAPQPQLSKNPTDP